MRLRHEFDDNRTIITFVKGTLEAVFHWSGLWWPGEGGLEVDGGVAGGHLKE